MRCAALWLAVAMTGGLVLADNSKISPDLIPLLANPSKSINVIVQYNTPPSQQSSGGGGLVGGLLGVVGAAVNLLGGVLNAVFSLIPAVSATLHPADVIGVSNQSNVAYISLDRPLGASLDYTAAAVGAPSAWTSGLDGSGIGIAVIDSGIYNHPDLNAANSRAIAALSTARASSRRNADDDFGHGTHVAGIAAGNGSSSSKPGAFRTFKGIAPNANMLDLRVLDLNGASNDSVVIAAIQKAVQLKNQYNVRVINLSLGRPIYRGLLARSFVPGGGSGMEERNRSRNGGGQSGPQRLRDHAVAGQQPACHHRRRDEDGRDHSPRSDDLIASYSSSGPTNVDLTAKPDVVAPGNLVDSLLAPGSTLVNDYPGQCGPSFQLHHLHRAGTPLYFTSERHQHGDAGGFRRRRSDARERSDPDSGYRQSAADEDRVQEFPGDERGAWTRPPARPYTDFYDMFTVGAGYIDVAAALTNYDRSLWFGCVAASGLQLDLQSAILVPNLAATWWSSPTWMTSSFGGRRCWCPARAGIGVRMGKQRFLGHQCGRGAPTPLGVQTLRGVRTPSWGTNASWGTSTQGEK